ncbi:MAG: hypothetical protein DI570_21275, partial [Phenylobacterium zucineum]
MIVAGIRRAATLAAATLALLSLPGAAQARWHRAETDRFVVYAEGREQTARDMAAKLMVFDSVLRASYPSTRQRKPPTKVQVVVVESAAELRRIQPRIGVYVRGFYAATDEGVFAVVVNGDAQRMGADDVLFHEYTHHFLLDNFSIALPAWFVEGLAEYFMTAQISPDAVRIGAYNEGRLHYVLAEPQIPLKDLLSKRPSDFREADRAMFYAQSWLLTHYMRSDPERGAQMDLALAAIAAGEDPVKAFETATGAPLDQLALGLSRYRKLWSYTIERNRKAPPPAMTVVAMPDSADTLLLDGFRLAFTRAGAKEEALLADVRRKAAAHPGDELAERVLARAEYKIGDVAAGEAISQRRLQARPDDAEELFVAGRGQFEAAQREPTSRFARIRKARPFLAKSHQLNQTDYRALYGYAMTRMMEPSFPTENDQAAFLLARDLAPAHKGVTFQAGQMLMRAGRKAEAAQVLAPLINDPHGGVMADRARALAEGKAGAADQTPL